MINQNIMIHKILPGDNLYKLAMQYKTTVDYILSANPNLNPYQLKIGDEIFIPSKDTNATLENIVASLGGIELFSSMRIAWLEHVFFVRSLIISIIDELKDTNATTNRLLKNAHDIGSIFNKYYDDEIAREITENLIEHVTVVANLIRAIKNKNDEEIKKIETLWIENANQIAATLAIINPNYIETDIRDMLYQHLDLTKIEINNRIAEAYTEDFDDFNNIEKQVLTMADYFTDGIIRQFPNKFGN